VLGYWEWPAEPVGLATFRLTPPPHQRRVLRRPSTAPEPPRGSPGADGLLVSGRASPLDAFRGYPKRLSCPAPALPDNRYTRGRATPFLSY